MIDAAIIVIFYLGPFDVSPFSKPNGCASDSFVEICRPSTRPSPAGQLTTAVLVDDISKRRLE